MKKKYFALVVALLLHFSVLSFAQSSRDSAGFVIDLPVLPKKLDLLEVGARISSFPGE